MFKKIFLLDKESNEKFHKKLRIMLVSQQSHLILLLS